ncbi:MAG: chloride channel protein [Chthoniobacterales bacterium]
MSLLPTLLNKLPAQTRGVVLTCIYGIAGSLVAVAFHHSISFVFDSIWDPLSEIPRTEFWQFALISFVVISVATLISGYLLAVFAPDAAGSGIPQLKLAYWRDMGVMPLRTVWVKFIAGTISVGGGLSLGREGPTVQMAGGLASWIASRAGIVKFERRTAAACGAAAGLAAAFNTPIAAVTFVLEEIVEDLNNRAIGRILLASVVSAFCLYFLVGNDPSFSIGFSGQFNWRLYLFGPFVALLASLVGIAFQIVTLAWRQRIKRGRFPAWLRPWVGGLITWVAACVIFYHFNRLGVLGLGYHDLNESLTGTLAWQISLALLAAKFIATSASYAWGGCGGIFAPTLFLGGMAGAAFAGLADIPLELTSEEQIILAVVGMSSCLGAVVRAPVTSILIVFELTHDFSLVPLLMLSAIISQAASRWLCADNFYGQILEEDGILLDKHMGHRDFAHWNRARVSTFANFKPVLLTSLDPDHVQTVLDATPHHTYPLTDESGRIQGVVERDDLVRLVATGEEPNVQTAATTSPDATIGDIQRQLVEAPLNIVILVDETRRTAIGIFTLHDLLRAQLAESERAGLG